MKETNRTLLALATIVTAMLMVAAGVYLLLDDDDEPCCENPSNEAEEFTASDVDGAPVSFGNSSATPAFIHFTNLEYPLCEGCADYVVAQAREMSRLLVMEPNATVITINLRYNTQSNLNGREILENDFGVNVTWPWIEEFSPYPVAAKYSAYWGENGLMFNPSVIIIDGDFEVVSAFHVYQALDGPVDGVVTAEELVAEAQNPGGAEPADDDTGIAFLFLVLLVAGVATLFSPCSLATMMLAFSAIQSRGRGDLTDAASGGKKPEDADGKKAWWRDGIEFGMPFSLGMVAAYLVLGLFIGAVGSVVIDSDAFYLGGGIVMIAFGVNTMYPFIDLAWERVKSLGRKDAGIGQGKSITERLVDLAKRSSGVAIFLLGLVFSVGMAPCALSLTLPVLVFVSYSKLGILAAGIVLSGFGIGRALPILLISFLSGGMRRAVSGRFLKAARYVSVAFGCVVIAVGLLFAARYFGLYLW